MFRDSLKKISCARLLVILAALAIGILLTEGSCMQAVETAQAAEAVQSAEMPQSAEAAQAAETAQPSEEEYQTQYDDAIKLANKLQNTGVLLHNKLYTAEQEVELQAWVDEACASAKSNRDKAGNLLANIRQSMEPGECSQLNAWDTLCDGDTELSVKDSLTTETQVTKKQADQQVYCYTFYDVCRLADIPCFVLEDSRNEYSQYDSWICMVYIENETGSGKGWHFVDVMADDGRFASRADVYTAMGSDFFPMDILLDYERSLWHMNVIFLNRETMRDAHSRSRRESLYLAYDRTSGKVKAYFESGALADGDQFYRTEAYIGEDGEAPYGWIETKDCSFGRVETYKSYAVYGVFLRGRIEWEGTEYDLQMTTLSSWVPYHGEAEVEPESEEHKAYAKAYLQKLRDKSIKIAETLLADENYIWNDINFSEEDEAYIRAAVDEALKWENIQTSHLSFEYAGISLEDEDPDHLSEKARTQAILCYIGNHVKQAEHGPFFTDSVQVLKDGEATCDGMNLLVRDMCVLAGVPCFRLMCSPTMNYGDSFFIDHGGNLVKADGEWFFCDLMSSRIMGTGFEDYPAGFMEGYDTGHKNIVWLDHEMVRKNHYGKWDGSLNVLNYYDFDSEGKLGIYRRDRYGKPVVYGDTPGYSWLWDSAEDVITQTDENGRYITENGLHTIDVEEENEDRTALVVSRYIYYYQSTRLLYGKQVIGGKEYDFIDYGALKHSGSQKIAELSRRYILSKLTFQPVEDQPYDKEGVCPIPEIYHGDKKLVLGRDFKIVEYMHNTDVTSYADASYKVEGLGDYVGNATRYFKIVPQDLSDLDVSLSQTSYTWSPKISQYKPEVYFDKDLTWQDYDVRYYDYDKIGRAKVVFTGKGHYTGSVTKYYDIAPYTWSAKDFQFLDYYRKPLQSQEFPYRFRSVTPDAKLFWYDEKGNDYALTEGVDYELSYRNTDHPGTATVTATAKGNYRGSVSCTYTINKYDIGDNDGVKKLLEMGTTGIGGGVKVIYTGEPVLPEMPDFGEMEEDVHYTMTATDNVDVGTAKITLQGIGDCTGTYTKEFEIQPCTLSEDMIRVEYLYTAYNGEVQKPSVTLTGMWVKGLVEGRDYFVTYEKEVDGEWQETEPKEAGSYRIGVRVTDNVRLYLPGVSDEDAPDCCYIDYRINNDGTGGGTGTGGGSGNGNTGSGTAGGGSGSGNTGSGTAGGGSGSGNTGSGTAGSGSGSGNTGSGTAGGGSGSSNTGTGTADGSGKDAVVSGDDGSAVSEIITSDSAYRIKKLKASPKKNAIKLSWSKVKKAKGYQIQISLYKNYHKAKVVAVKKSKTSYTLKKLKKNKKYYIRVRAYKGTAGKGRDKKKVYGQWKSITKKIK